MPSVNNIRQTFINYFESKGHQHLPSSPLVPQNDPSLMFANAGMNQFKDIITGKAKAKYKRVVTSQKCVRAGGKHNDLDNVGYTARHHTFFEMLGNFSFGCYGKKEAIGFAWELLTDQYKIDPKKLLVTVYYTDAEAEQIWQDLGVEQSKIIKITTDDNFWSMGDTGPCGPCSEIFYDHGPEITGGPPGTPDEDGDRFIEIWNLVFMQYNRLDDGTQEALPHICIDTGIGLERITAVLNHKHNNFDIDIFENIINHTATQLNLAVASSNIASFRVIADHLRSTCFLIADGVMPANEGRGYVLRRILRRMLRHVHQLGGKLPVVYTLCTELIKEMGQTYPELELRQDLITSLIKQEELKFSQLLKRGIKLLDEESSKLTAG
ncbi:MAG: alanine--tRNA ligase, partial [Pseudomonadota bacterium]